MVIIRRRNGYFPHAIPPPTGIENGPVFTILRELIMKLHHFIATLLATVFPFAAFSAEKIDDAKRKFFESRIRPVLVESCYECHSSGAKKVGGKLLLDSPDALRDGGESGAPMVAGKPDASLLIHALRYENDLEMPPEKPLPETVIADFIKWINMGAPDPRASDPDKKAEAPTLERQYKEGELWSFQAVEDPSPPSVKNTSWPRSSIDRFVLAKIEKEKLTAASDATPQNLIRRLSIDLTGLPPSFDEVQGFTDSFQAKGQEATIELINQLLASPHFGERWGQHWLDVARFAESNGNDGLSRNPTFPHAWRYRDYVIAALNEDTPYDQFLTEQIAGDLLEHSSPEQRDRFLTATGFLAIGSKPAKAMNNNFNMDVVADQIEVVSTGLLGLSVGCARCHDHKFDPIPTKDYYALAGFFTSTEPLWGIAANEKLTAPPTQLHLLTTPPKSPPPPGVAEKVALIESKSNKNNPPPKKEFTYPVGAPLAMGVRDRKKPANCKINLKGDAKKLGAEVPRGFLTAYPEKLLPAASVSGNQSGRLELAAWVTDSEHPHTARVMVNRIWLHLFGQAIVGTPDDFGVYGDRPTHPELLDHLATRFVKDHKWSIKAMIREIVLSRTYQLATEGTPESLQLDPENKLLTRHLQRRLDAESLRDTILKVSDQLNVQSADGSIIRHLNVLVNHAGNLHEPSNHRSVYLCRLRNSPPPELAAFDLPPAIKVTGKRNETTLPTQALFLLNSEFVLGQSQLFAKAVSTESSSEKRIQKLWQKAYNRAPSSTETADALYLVENVGSESDIEPWTTLAQSLFASNEFRYVD